MRFILLCVVATLFLGCKTMTPEERAIADRAQAAYVAAGQRVADIGGTIEQHIAEYDAIRARLAAGETLPAAVMARYSELQALLKMDREDYENLKNALAEAKKAMDAAMAAGIPWYEQIPWAALGTLVIGAAGMYFPVARPATMAAQAIIQGVAAHSSKSSVDESAVKDSVLAASRKLGVEAIVDKLVQKYDPPS